LVDAGTNDLPILSARVNHDAYINFLAVGVQLLPVLWIALALEATTLRAAFKAASDSSETPS
jgi:hypothetical protein